VRTPQSTGFRNPYIRLFLNVLSTSDLSTRCKFSSGNGIGYSKTGTPLSKGLSISNQNVPFEAGEDIDSAPRSQGFFTPRKGP